MSCNEWKRKKEGKQRNVDQIMQSRFQERTKTQEIRMLFALLKDLLQKELIREKQPTQQQGKRMNKQDEAVQIERLA